MGWGRSEKAAGVRGRAGRTGSRRWAELGAVLSLGVAVRVGCRAGEEHLKIVGGEEGTAGLGGEHGYGVRSGRAVVMMEAENERVRGAWAGVVGREQGVGGRGPKVPEG
ncbi:uncharacterized protein A4U43_C08F26730 [Asparagus officinalis]|nr:uncharacterized protein A4U43_C08F26730 [Asparagus officinalis]